MYTFLNKKPFVFTKKLIFSLQKNERKQRMKITMVTTRFNIETWEENSKYRERYKEIACIYGPSRKMSEKIELNSLVFVLEMNNSLNRIEGIGLIRNRVQFDKKYCVYNHGNFNRYTYKSNYRLDRSKIDTQLLELFDYILFKEKTHLKRGCGFTMIPPKLFLHEKCRIIGDEEDIKRRIIDLFKREFST